MSTLSQLQQAILSPAGQSRLSQVYGISAEHTRPHQERLGAILKGFHETFPDNRNSAILCTAAGRTEVGGNHTDHQRGKVLAASVSLDAVACAAPNGAGVARLYSQGYGMVEVAIADLGRKPEEENSTLSLVRGILARIAQLGYAPEGFDAYLQSQVPGGSGLSSSACYEVLVGVVINQLFCRGVLSLAELAQIGQYAENVYFGKPSGLMDQMACALGGIVAIDFREEGNPVFHQVDFNFSQAGHSLCIVDTGADHADLTADYGAIPLEMRSVAQKLGQEVLSQVEPGDFYKKLPWLRTQVGDRAVLRAIHYFNDVERVSRQVVALERGDFSSFLSLVRESGRSSFSYLQNISTYRDPNSQPVAVALAVAEQLLNGKGACRVHGGGFAGTIQAFVPLETLDSFRSGMDQLLGDGACQVLSIRPVGGAALFQ